MHVRHPAPLPNVRSAQPSSRRDGGAASFLCRGRSLTRMLALKLQVRVRAVILRVPQGQTRRGAGPPSAHCPPQRAGSPSPKQPDQNPYNRGAERQTQRQRRQRPGSLHHRDEGSAQTLGLSISQEASATPSPGPALANSAREEQCQHLQGAGDTQQHSFSRGQRGTDVSLGRNVPLKGKDGGQPGPWARDQLRSRLPLYASQQAGC